MDSGRRNLCLLLPALLASVGRAKGEPSTLPSKTVRFDELPVHVEGGYRLHPLVQGETHTGFAIEVHATEVEPGATPHPTHHHLHEEMILVHEGRVEVTIGGESSILTPGSAAYLASNVEHGFKNAGPGGAKYFVLSLGADQ